MINKYRNIFLTLLIFILLVPQKLSAQNNELVLSNDFNNLEWTDFVTKIEKDYNYTFYYDLDSFPNFKISIQKNNNSLKQVLKTNLSSFSYFAAIDKNKNIYITKNKAISTELPKSFYSNSKSDFNND